MRLDTTDGLYVIDLLEGWITFGRSCFVVVIAPSLAPCLGFTLLEMLGVLLKCGSCPLSLGNRS